MVLIFFAAAGFSVSRLLDGDIKTAVITMAAVLVLNVLVDNSYKN